MNNWTASVAIIFFGLFVLFFLTHLSQYHAGALRNAYIGVGVATLLLTLFVSVVFWMMPK